MTGDQPLDAAVYDTLADHPAVAAAGGPLYVVAIGQGGAWAWPLPALRSGSGVSIPEQVEAIDAVAKILRACAEDLEARAGLVRAVEDVEATP